MEPDAAEDIKLHVDAAVAVCDARSARWARSRTRSPRVCGTRSVPWTRRSTESRTIKND
jgi:hypothetical protein